VKREQVIADLARHIAAMRLDHPVRVGVDGVDASGKTTLADELVEPLRRLGHEVIRASIDGFHNPRRIRYRQGRHSPRGYYEDSFDHDAIVTDLLLALGPGGDLRYRSARFDHRTDSPVDAPWRQARCDAILVFEGVFLHRPELCRHWNFTVFVDADCAVTLARARRRDVDLFGDADGVEEAYRRRYIPGQHLYLNAVRPMEKASVVVHNNDFRTPRMTMRDSSPRVRQSVAAEPTGSAAMAGEREGRRELGPRRQ
jgi:uridine kinase